MGGGLKLSGFPPQAGELLDKDLPIRPSDITCAGKHSWSLPALASVAQGKRKQSLSLRVFDEALIRTAQFCCRASTTRCAMALPEKQHRSQNVAPKPQAIGTPTVIAHHHEKHWVHDGSLQCPKSYCNRRVDREKNADIFFPKQKLPPKLTKLQLGVCVSVHATLPIPLDENYLYQ